jgi:hypothetical protein
MDTHPIDEQCRQQAVRRKFPAAEQGECFTTPPNDTEEAAVDRLQCEFYTNG